MGPTGDKENAKFKNDKDKAKAGRPFDPGRAEAEHPHK
jgi:hypothetical protein